tara:strand:- start:317 stop:559 length:243 start_codon:yes stop_codon:yes gene_type:complete
MSKYTQREWDRVVGWGTVPPEYAYDEQYDGLQVIVRDKKDYDLVTFENKGDREVVQYACNRTEGERILKMYREGYGREQH